MILYIKHMVCDRCVMVVCEQLEKSGFHPVSVRLGEAEFRRTLSDDEISKIKSILEPLGFSLIDDHKRRLTEQTKQAIIRLVHQDSIASENGANGRSLSSAGTLKTNLSDYLSETLHHDYKYLSATFSDIENVTIEQYVIAQKVERVKELLVYGELSLTEIANRMNYSSVAYLSAQFRRITGFTPSEFRRIKGDKRRPIDKVAVQ